MDDFAWFLYKEDRDVFQNVHRVKRLLKLADRRFHDGDELMPSFFNPCTHDIERECWAFSFHNKLNAVLLPHGFEMIAIHENSFALQTLENSEYVLYGPDDLFSMCIWNWLLRTHWCISKVVLNVATVARFHAPLFWRLLSLNVRHLEKVELVGLPADDGHFNVCRLFVNSTQLSEIVIVHITLNDNQAELLCSVLNLNEGLKGLVLRFVSMTTMGLDVLREAIKKCSRPTYFELQEKIRPCETLQTAVARLLEAPVSKLYLEAPCNWAELFKLLRYNMSLSELEIVDYESFMNSSLKDLADALLQNSTLRRLKLCVSIPQMNHCVTDQWCELTRAIGQNRGLKSLSFDSSNFGEDCVAMAELAQAIAQNRTLVDLSVEDCDLSLASLFFLFCGLSHNETMETLHIGTLLVDEEVNHLMLERIAELGLGERVDCIYVLRSDWQLVQSQEAFRMTRFRRARVVHTCALDGDCYLNILHHAQDTLTFLYIEGVAGVPLSCTGADCLGDLFANSSVLEHVTLLFDVDADTAITILEGLALSRTIYSVVIGHRWQLSGKVAIAFEETFRNNSSIAELTIWQDTRMGFEELKAHLRLGVKRNHAVYVVRFLYGPQKRESHDWALFQMLHNNRIAASWAADIILGNSWTGACMYAFIRMKACNNSLAVLRHATGCVKEELESKIVEAWKQSEREIPDVSPAVTENDGRIEASRKSTNALHTLNKDFIEEVKIFFKAQKHGNKASRAQDP